MDPITDPRQAGERLLAFAREGRLVQCEWNAVQGGREVACLLGAAAGITDVNECPASLMPAWMAHALLALFDGQTEAHAQTFARRWGEAMVRDEWSRIDWDTVRGEWMAFVVMQARDAATAAYAASYAARDAAYASTHAAHVAARVVHAADSAHAAASAAAHAADAAGRSAAAARTAARDAQADALMDAIEKAMEVARG